MDRSWRVLELHKILSQLADKAASALGRERALALGPAAEPGTMREWLKQTGEAVAVCRRYQVPRHGIVDIRVHVQRARPGGMLDPGELNQVLSTIQSGGRLRRFLLGLEDSPWLEAMGRALPQLPELEGEISECITNAGELSDQASPELGRVRRQLRALAGRIRERLDSMVRSPEIARYLQEPLVTVRGDRYVLPVKQEQRAAVPGLVHDQSSSGATLFIEPMAVVELGSELRRMRLAEQREIERVLLRLSARVGAHGEELGRLLEVLGELDLTFAKAALGLEHEGSEPEIASDRRLVLRSARHPLLGCSAVPVDVLLGGDYDVLVITGPNTGGKTVTLKTTGLCVLMAQAGLYIPAAPGCRVPPYTAVMCDIGDEQSIEQSLSTFSSHMTNIVEFLRKSDGQSLVLLDELGAGTDPMEGSALAMAILEHLLSVGAHVVATTHYSELKGFAHQQARVENASVEFDPATLRPTFRLLTGLPGKSNAFAIAERLGLDPAVVQRARELGPAPGRLLEELLAEFHENRFRAGEDRREAAAARARAQRLEDELRAEVARQEASKREVLARARQEAKDLVARTRAEVQSLLKELRSAQHPATVTRAIQERLEPLRESLAATEEKVPAGPPLEDLQVGEAVRVVSLGLDGHVTQVAGPGEKVQVQVGIMKVMVEPGDLSRTAATASLQQADGLGRLMADKAAILRPELDVRGLPAGEALDRVDKYLDDAVMAGTRRVRIIHGKGTGVLRRAISGWLVQHPRVESHQLAPPQEGGEGVT
ncbi:MAG TPA: endonuclease MutS2, partial [Clostridiales bacterium UBA8153]|nr:endonuclease MutS2 [Clostridiales bacterium UBA8153]